MGAQGSSSIFDKARSRGSDGTVEEGAVGTVDDDGPEGFRAIDEDVAGDFRRVDDDDDNDDDGGSGDFRMVDNNGAGDFQTHDWTEGSLFLFDEEGSWPGVRTGGLNKGRSIRRLQGLILALRVRSVLFALSA
jgi:hypothetical protein